MSHGTAATMLRGLVLGMIAVTAVGATVSAYAAVGHLLVGRWPAAGGPVFCGAALALGAWLLCRHREDLIYC